MRGCAALGGRLERTEPPVEQLVHGAVAVAGGGKADEGLALGVEHLVRVRVRVRVMARVRARARARARVRVRVRARAAATASAPQKHAGRICL